MHDSDTPIHRLDYPARGAPEGNHAALAHLERASAAADGHDKNPRISKPHQKPVRSQHATRYIHIYAREAKPQRSQVCKREAKELLDATAGTAPHNFGLLPFSLVFVFVS